MGWITCTILDDVSGRDIRTAVWQIRLPYSHHMWVTVLHGIPHHLILRHSPWAHVPHLWVMYGVGSSLIFTSCLLITAQYFTRWRALAITIVSGGHWRRYPSVGPTTEALVDSVGWQGALRIVAGAMAFVALLGCSYDEIKKEGDKNVSVVYKTNNSGNELGFTNVTFGQQDVGANGLRRQHTDEDVQVTNGDDTITMKDSVIENGFVNGIWDSTSRQRRSKHFSAWLSGEWSFWWFWTSYCYTNVKICGKGRAWR